MSGKLGRWSFAIALLVSGAWGVMLAVEAAYQSYLLYPNRESEALYPVSIALVLANSLVTCLLGLLLIDCFAPWMRLRKENQFISAGKNSLIVGGVLVLSGVGGLLFTGYAAVVATWWRLLLPWTDMDPTLPYAIIDVLITSICACWLGVKLARARDRRSSKDSAISA